MEKSMIRKKEKSKLNILIEHFKLPNYLKGIGGDLIFKQLAVKSRKEIANLQSISHEISSTGHGNDKEFAQLSPETSLGDMSLYWPCPYGSGWTSVDFLSREPNVKIP